MKLKELKRCLDRLPSEFDDTEVNFTEKIGQNQGNLVHDIDKVSYGEYSTGRFIYLRADENRIGATI